jgi:hypothetical protein
VAYLFAGSEPVQFFSGGILQDEMYGNDPCTDKYSVCSVFNFTTRTLTFLLDVKQVSEQKKTISSTFSDTVKEHNTDCRTMG